MVQAWSIGTSKRSTDWKATSAAFPGAGAYTPEKKQRRTAPSWRIGTSNRSNLGLNNSPGPGAYNVKPIVTNEGSRYTMRPKTSVKPPNENTPGSGSYDPKIYSQYKRPVAYSMGLKASLSESRLMVPGPGQYNSRSSVENRPSYKFGKDTNRDFYLRTQSPGPGTYRQDLRPNSASAPKYGFGTSSRDGFYKDGAQPGPGQYENKGAFDPFFSRTAQGATMISRRVNPEDSMLKQVPGPGAYEPRLSSKKSAPAFKIGTSTRDQLNKSASYYNPGAGTYNPSFIDRPKSPSYRMGSDVRKALTESVYTPGPGTYEIPHRGIEGPKLSFKGVGGADPVQRERIKVPGAGTYNPSVELVKMRPSSAKIGTALQRPTFQQLSAPGVGNYELRARTDGPRWGFGSEIQRPSSSTGGIAPGPGQYKLKPYFADVPKYLIPHAASSKYL